MKTKVRSVASWVYDRLNLGRDTQSIRSYDFNSEDIQRVTHLMARFSAGRENIRTINWLLPYAKHPLFAGIYTILRFADYFTREKGITNCIVLYDCNNADLSRLTKQIGSLFPSLSSSVVGLQRGMESLPPSDITIATCWQSAFFLLKVNNTRGKFYFVQDFEPLFYPGSATYGLVAATYSLGYWGIANTAHLGALLRGAYGMTVRSFTPAVDTKLFYPLPNRQSRPVRIFFYGRPRNPRNGFRLGIEALKIIKARFQGDVDIISAGGDWQPSSFGARNSIKNVGILKTVEEVGELYRSCHIGLYFMFSEHPSYQPLELMASGAAVVTNDNPATKCFLRNGENALLVQPSLSSVVEALSRLIRDEQYRTLLANRGLNASNQTNWDSEMEAVYQFVCGSGQLSDLNSPNVGQQSHEMFTREMTSGR